MRERSGTPGVPTTVVQDLASFRATVAGAFLPLRVESRRPDELRGALRSVVRDDVHLSDLTATTHSVERSPAMIGPSDPPMFKLSLMLSGRGLLVQDGREAVLRPGDLALYDTSRPYSMLFDDDFRMMVVMFRRSALAIPASDLDTVTAVTIAGGDGLGSVAGPYFAGLAGNLEHVAGVTGSGLVRATLELTTSVYAHQLGVDASDQDPHHRLLRSVCTHIEERLGSPDLSPTTIAAAHYVSVRHLHEVFDADGRTVSAWIRHRRLERIRQDLLDPALADVAVSALAARWCFPDAAHFSRVFKEAYGQAPSRYRAAHLLH